MTEQEIIQSVEDYFNEMLAKDADYLDHVTDSWIYDAEQWFLNLLRQKGIKIYTDEMECDFQKEVVASCHIFWTLTLKRKDELYEEKYGKRDALFELDRMVCDVKQINKTFERIKHYFKKFNTYTNVVTEQFEELVKYLQLLNDIENDRIESLKEK